MFKHILVPVDGSATAQKAVEQAAGLAKAFGSAVTVIYVIDPYPFTGLGSDFAYGQAEYLGAATAEANEAIKAAKEAFQGVGITVTGSVVEGHAIYRGILDTAESINADLIVMGSHGRRGIAAVVLGSVTQSVLTHCAIPVLVIR